MANFNVVGKISAIKDTEKFHPIERRDFQSGWTNTTVNFNVISDTNRIPCRIQGGKWKDDKKNVIKSFTKSVTNSDGSVTKGEKIDIPWSKRFEQDQIDKVAGFRKFVFGDEVYLSEWDFAERMITVLNDDTYKDTLFKISGSYDISYNAEKDKFYTNYHVNRVYIAEDGAEPKAELTMDFYFQEGCWDDSNVEETGKVYVNGWTNYYDNNLKKTGFRPTVVVVPKDKAVAALKKKFDAEDDGIKHISLLLDIIEGAERKEITMDMLDEEVREDIEAGLLDFEQVKREMGGNVIGDRVSELRYKKLASMKGVQDTVYTEKDMHPAREEIEGDVDIFSDYFDDEL